MAGVTIEKIDRNNLGARDYEKVVEEALEDLGIRVPTLAGTQKGLV